MDNSIQKNLTGEYELIKQFISVVDRESLELIISLLSGNIKKTAIEGLISAQTSEDMFRYQGRVKQTNDIVGYLRNIEGRREFLKQLIEQNKRNK